MSTLHISYPCEVLTLIILDSVMWQKKRSDSNPSLSLLAQCLGTCSPSLSLRLIMFKIKKTIYGVEMGMRFCLLGMENGAGHVWMCPHPLSFVSPISAWHTGWADRAAFGGKKYRDLLGTLGVFRDCCGPAATCLIEQEWQISLFFGATSWWKRASLPSSCSGLGPCSFFLRGQFLSVWSANHVLVFY